MYIISNTEPAPINISHQIAVVNIVPNRTQGSWLFLSIASLLLVLLLITGRYAEAAVAQVPESFCTPSGNDDVVFAHCDDAPRLFRTVLLAIHGWDGSCHDTFGKDQASLFSVLSPHRYFDWDCFKYDSHNLDINSNTLLLDTRLKKLRDFGYTDVIMVTHSTGGILALHSIADRFVNRDGGWHAEGIVDRLIKGDLLRITDVIAWAAPLEGLDWSITKLARTLNFFGVSRATLPMLDPERNSYLSRLKKRLHSVDRFYQAQTAEGRAAVRSNVYLYHGQKNDWVVKSIDEAKAREHGWFWPDRMKIIDTRLGHLDNVANAGSPRVHGFPADVIEMRALLSVKLQPRTETVFPLDLPDYATALRQRQMSLVEGVIYYANWGFQRSVPELMEFLRYMLLERFPRDKSVDEMLASKLINVYEEKLAEPPTSWLAFSTRFAREIIAQYDASGLPDRTRFGHHEPAVIRKVQALIELIRRTAQRFGDEHGWQLPIVEGMPTTAEDLAVDMLAMQSRLLDSERPEVRNEARRLLHASFSEYTNTMITRSNLYAALGRDLAKNANHMIVAQKETIGNLWLEGLKRDSGVRVQVAEAASMPVQFAGRKVPGIVALQSEPVAKRFLVAAVPDRNEEIEPFYKLNTVLARHVGVHGNNTTQARHAGTNLRDILKIAPATAAATLPQRYPLTGAELVKWPNLQRELARNLSIKQ